VCLRIVIARPAGKAGAQDRRLEVADVEVAVAEGATFGRGEDELIGPPAGEEWGQPVDEESGERHGAALVVLRRSEVQPATTLGGGFGDLESAVEKVDAVDAKRRHLA